MTYATPNAFRAQCAPRMTPRLDVLALGEPMVEFSQIPGDPGRYLHGFGGDTMNAAIAAARQGARAGYVTRLGDDEFGRELLEFWRGEGLDATGVAVDPDAPTAVYFITHGPEGHVFSYRRAGSAASRMRPSDVPLDLIAVRAACTCRASARRSVRTLATRCSPRSSTPARTACRSRTTPTCG
jgi:sugar/nucleoside kinase (ribokinase family)